MLNKILVTGHRGFIGTHLMRALPEAIGYDILDGNDILNIETLEKVVKDNNIDTIIHLAAISNRQETDKNPQLSLTTNVVGSYNVLEVAKRHNVYTILASSAAIYEPDKTIYGASKDFMEKLSRFFENVTIFRMFNVYGEGSKSVIGIFENAIEKGEPITLNGNTIRDYIHIDDVVAKFLEVLKTKPSLIEVGTGTGRTLLDVVELIETKLGKKANIIQKEPINEIQKSVMKI